MVIKKVCSQREITAFCCCPRGWSVDIYPCWLVGWKRGDLIRPGGELLSCFVVLGNDQEEKCRSFIELTPGETQGRREKKRENTESKPVGAIKALLLSSFRRPVALCHQ